MDLYTTATMGLTNLLFAQSNSGSGNAFKVKPDASNAPGSDGLQDAINGFAYYALLACAAGFVLGGIIWAIGGRLGNDYTATGGKVGMVTAVAVAFLIGAAGVILGFSFDTGSSSSASANP